MNTNAITKNIANLLSTSYGDESTVGMNNMNADEVQALSDFDISFVAGGGSVINMG